MIIGLFDCDSHNFPNLALMKISAWHKQQGDNVEWLFPMTHYDKVYVSKVFGNEYSEKLPSYIDADEIICGGTGFAITIENGVEVYHPEKDKPLPAYIEHIYPDYSLYPDLTKDTAFGFLTRGCCNNCDFCIVSKKEGLCSLKVADLSEFWSGQKYIKLLDPNILACHDRVELLKQLTNSKAKVDFTQGLDARFITKELCEILNDMKIDTVHFAFDSMKNEKAILQGLKCYAENCSHFTSRCSKNGVYILTNYDTTFEQDLYRVQKVIDLGYYPYVMIYRKTVAPHFLRDLQRWSNNRILFNSTSFSDYRPRGNRKIKDIYKDLNIDF